MADTDGAPEVTTPPAATPPAATPPAAATPAPAGAEEPKPAAGDYMTKADFKAAMDEWKAEQVAEAAKKAPAPQPKPKVEETPPAAGAPAGTAEEPRYGSKSWFNRG